MNAILGERNSTNAAGPFVAAREAEQSVWALQKPDQRRLLTRPRLADTDNSYGSLPNLGTYLYICTLCMYEAAASKDLAGRKGKI